jgi:hypothetical protein
MRVFYPKAITPACQRALNLLRGQPFLTNYYLAGATALALQIGHRISTDLDWFTSSVRLESLEREALRSLLTRTGQFEVRREQDGQVFSRLAGADVSFVYQHHPLLEPTIDYEGIPLASPTDIGLMKLAAINDRGSRRDFIDLYCLREIAHIERLVELAEIKYADRPTFLDITVRAPAYFVDAEQQPMPRVLWKDVSWEAVIKYAEAGARWLTRRLRDKYR